MVVAAASKQMAELNTNTRFLNDRMITFAEKLTSTLPDKLTLCFFVNSRFLQYTHTQNDGMLSL